MSWTDNIPKWLRELGAWLAVLVPAAEIASQIFPDRRLHFYFAALTILLAIAGGRLVGRATREAWIALREASGHIALVMLVPMLLVVVDTHFTIGRVEQRVTVPYPPVSIAIKNSPPLGGLFNASEDYRRGLQLAQSVPMSAVIPPEPGYTHVYTVGDEGADWVLKGNEGCFSYDRHDAGFTAEWASSGGYVSFPDIAIDTLVYQYLTFECKVLGALGTPDLGLRLVVDDFGISGANKEIAVYEMGSLSRYVKARPLSSSWQKYEVYAGSLLELTSDTRPAPSGETQKNEINKIVFFVSDAMLAESAGGTVCIRNVVFSTSSQLTQ